MVDKLNWSGFNAIFRSRWGQLFFLLMWVIIGASLRFSRLEMKPLWTDEFATMVFSLGNTFQTVPLDRAIDIDTLLQPLKPQIDRGVGDAIDRLLNESTHPPLYFVLAHLWLKLFPIQNEVVLVWASRALSAIFGVLSIPAMFGFAWLAFRSRLVAQLSAAIMAVSPLGIFLAQEARHYTLGILLVIASLSCFIVAVRFVEKRSSLPAWLGLIWVIINSLGIANHYFFALTLIAQALVLLLILVKEREKLSVKYTLNSLFVSPHWRPILIVALGTLAGGLVWLPVLHDIQDSELTKWVYIGDPVNRWLGPLIRLLSWLLSIILLIPIDISNLNVINVGFYIIVILAFLFWLFQMIKYSIVNFREHPDKHFRVKDLSIYFLASLFVILGITYALGTDLTLAPRFQYFYFPVAIALLAACFAAYGSQQTKNIYRLPITFGKLSVGLILLIGLLGGITVVWNVGYLQHERSDAIASAIQKESEVPVLIAHTHKHHGQTGRMMGLAWELKRFGYDARFLLAHKHQGLCKDNSCNDPNNDPATTLLQTVAKLPRPLDVWAVNFHAPILLEEQNCAKAEPRWRQVEGFRFRRYLCR
ncbi:MAG TPA: hypothetical protein V6D28_14100 [Leptolyngbyaceae cyanobacterium]